MNTQQTTDKQAPQRGRGVARVAAIGVVALFILLAYTFLHEGGHAVAGLLFGGTITSFSVSFWDLSAHVGIQGDFSPLQRGLISVAGVGLPLVVWGLYIAQAPRTTNASLGLMRVVGSLGVLNTLLAWIVIPILYLYGQAPGDDATNFIERTGAAPLLVTGVASTTYIAGWALLLSDRGGLRHAIRRLPSAEDDLLSPASLKVLRYVVAATIVIASVAAGLSLYFAGAGPSGMPADVPAGYSRVANVDLSQHAMANEAAYSFLLAAPTEIRFFVVLKDTRGPAEISLVGPNGYRSTFLKLEGDDTVGRATVHPAALLLEQGGYRVEITLPQTTGDLSVYAKGTPPTPR